MFWQHWLSLGRYERVALPLKTRTFMQTFVDVAQSILIGAKTIKE